MDGRTIRSAVVAVLGCSLGCDVAGVSDAAEPAAAAADAPRSGDGFARGGAQHGGAPMGQRWVLRDAMGTAIDAVVEPSCPGGGCTIDDPGTQGALHPMCVRLYWMGDEYVNLRYDLGSGLAADCTWHQAELRDVGVFLDSSCSGGIYQVPGEGMEDPYRWTRRAYFADDVGELYYERAGDVQTITTYYSLVDGQCTEFNVQPTEVVEWRVLPPGLLALAGVPPYNMFWE